MIRLLAAIALTVCLAGCGQSDARVATQSSEQDFQRGRDAFERKDYAQAAQIMDDALRRGGLNPDLASEALMLRATSNIQLGKLNEAEADLEEARKGPTPRDQIFAARGDIAILKGVLVEARRLYEKAQAANPEVRLPDKLSK